MARFDGIFYSKELARPTHFVAVLCNDNAFGTENNPHYKRPTKNVYLLHGFSGCDTDWFSNAPMGEIANKYNVNFFMPNGDNSFYLDNKATGYKYASYVGEEFVEYTRKTFNLSDKREDTYIGGLSMGGFGALHTALMFPETFGKCAALSSALIHNEVADMKEGSGNEVANYEYYRECFGDPSKLKESVNNPEYLVKQLKEKSAKFPAIFMACGTEDFLIENNRKFHAFLEEEGVKHTYVEGKGIHDMVFWSEYAAKFIPEMFG